jgi:sarcosine oxidase subunit gamma
MVEPFVSTPVIANLAVSPLGDAFGPRRVPGPTGTCGIEITERFGLALCDVAAWPGEEKTLARAVTKAGQSFDHAPGRWTVLSDHPALAENVTKAVGTHGTVCDLSHGRTIIRLSGPKVEWVLAKLFAIDFDKGSFPKGKGLATQHHEIYAQIYRCDDLIFDIIIFRSYARSFMETLTTLSGDVGYEIV